MSLANGPAKNLDYSGQLDASLVIGGLGLSEIVHIFMKMLQNSQIPHLVQILLDLLLVNLWLGDSWQHV